MGGAERRGRRGSTSPGRPARTSAATWRATSRSSSATTTAAPTSCSRPPTRPGRPTTSTAATASTADRRVTPTRSATTGRSRRAATPTEDWLFNAEYPMVRWLERNGYDVSYFTDVDSDRNGAEILEHEAFLSVGHDEYWSAGQRANVEAARDAGVDLAFFSGNEIYWKTRWEPSTADGRQHRPPDAGLLQGGRRARAAPSTGTATGTSPATRTRTRGPACGGRTPRGTTAGGPRTACPVRSAGATPPPPSRSRRPTPACGSGGTPAIAARPTLTAEARSATSSTGSSRRSRATYPPGRITAVRHDRRRARTTG